MKLHFHPWRVVERLQHRAVPLGFGDQVGDLLGRRVWCLDLETQPDALEADRRLLRDAQRPAQVEIPLHDDLDAFGRDPHCGRNHLARHLGARGERAQQQIAGAGGRAGPTDADVRFRLLNRAPQIDRTGDWRVGLTTSGGQRDAGRVGLGPVALLEGLLLGPQVHGVILARIGGYKPHNRKEQMSDGTMTT